MIIPSLLDTDLYKFTMMQAVLHQYPAAQVQYRFKCRTPGIDLAAHLPRISDEIDALCTLRFTPGELDYLRSLRFIKPDFVDFLGLFHFDRKYVSLKASAAVPGEIELEIEGPWLHTILFEVPLLAIINEVYFQALGQGDLEEGARRLDAKIERLRAIPDATGCAIADYGTRRRYSRAWHALMLPRLRDGLGAQLVGTSNVYFARQYGMTPLGTMAHEWLQAFQALGPRLRDSQGAALEAWAREYRGDLGIALSDVVGTDAFLRDYDMYFCKLFDGMRHDSGDPFAWGERMLAHLAANRAEPAAKSLVFSDGLDVDKVERLYAHFHGRCRLAFGIGTNLTNDLGPKALNIVVKMTRCNGQPVAKLSDSPGKSMCDDPGYVRYLRQVFGLPPEEIPRMIRDIVRMGEPVLLQLAEPVEHFANGELRDLVEGLFQTMDLANGVGLAAPQVAVSKRVIVFGFDSNARYPDAPAVPRTALFNPLIEPLSDELEDGWEGCLSIPGLRAVIPRFKRIRYTGWDAEGKRVDQIAEGFHARVVQHEVDHLDGILYPSRIRDFGTFGFTDVLFPGIDDGK